MGTRGLVDQIAELIGTEIVSGHLPAGSSLPNEADWCESLGVSRTVLREAVSALASKGLIETKPRVGGRVRPRERWHRLDPAMLRWQLAAGPDEVFLTELFELRRLIEPAAAALAAERAEPLHIRELEAAYADMVAASDNGDGFLAADSRFHQTILGAVGNGMIKALSAVVSTAIDLSLGLSLGVPEGQSHSLPLHRAVLDAIAARVADAAREAMLHLIDQAETDGRRALLQSRSRTAHGKSQRPNRSSR